MKFRGIGLQPREVATTVVLILLLLGIEFLDESGRLQKWWKAVPALQWLFYQFVLLLILFWGTGYSVENFIYFQF